MVEPRECGICSICVQTRGLLDCCNHLFCFSCITEWFTVSNLCPLCKSRSRFITPQMLCSDTGRWERLESVAGAVSGDEEPGDEDGQPVTFPPYFIDEEAVLCLEGDRCLVRAGLLDLDAEGSAASDTSVACDLCDCWYHGGCVNFQPDQTSFICPRCLTSKEMDRVAMDAPNQSIIASSENASSTRASSPSNNQFVYRGQTVFGSASVAIEDPEEGESHVSISLRRFPEEHPVKTQRSREPQPSVEDTEKDLMWSPIREPFVTQKYGAAWMPVPEAVPREPKPCKEEFLSSSREPSRKVPYFQEELWSPTRDPPVKVPLFREELWSPTRETIKDLSFVGTKFTAASVNSSRTPKLSGPESRGIRNPVGPRAVIPPQSEIFDSSTRTESFSVVVPKTVTASEARRGLLHLDTTEIVAHPMQLNEQEMSIDVGRLQVAVEQLRKGKRKVLQEDERNIDIKGLPEMPRKIARKQVINVDVPDDKAPVTRKDLLIKATTDQFMGKQTAVKAANILESAKKMEGLDDTSLVATKEEKRIGAYILASKDEKRMAVDDVASTDEKGMAVDNVASMDEKRMAVDDVASKDEKRMVVDDVASKDEKRMAVDDVASKDEKRMAVDDVASKEEKEVVSEGVITSPEEKSLGADVASNEEKGMAIQVLAVKRIDTPHSKFLGDSAVKTEPTEVSTEDQFASPQSEDLSAPEKLEVSGPVMDSEVDVMDIVKDTRACMVKDVNEAPCPPKGVRTGIIMHREQDISNSALPSLVERIRQQMRNTPGYGVGDDFGKVEVSDDRFIAAFRAAQIRSYEKSKDVKSVSSKPQTSGRLWKVLDKKYSATGGRDNLIRKLYAGGGRKCWDRDWDIAFWRERDPHQRRSRKEAEGEVDGLGIKNMQPDSEDAEFFNRLYVADTSLFPRNEDLKPLSVQANLAEGTSATEPEKSRTGKVSQLPLDKLNPTLNVKDSAQQFPVVQDAALTSSGADKLLKGVNSVDPLPSKTLKKSLKPFAVSTEISVNANASASASSGKSRGTPSAPLRQHGKDMKVTTASSDVRKDKRQWALEVLARKEGKLSNTSSSGKTGGGCSVSKDNPFPLLLQLPVEMRPLILGDSRRNKIPPAVRQVQLNRLVEQELKRAKLAVIEKSSECDDAVARAVSREEELCKISNSKGVYLNRCARALANTEYEVKVEETSPPEGDGDSGARVEESSRPDDDEVVRKALQDTGLMDSPTAESVDDRDGHRREGTQDANNKVLDTNRARAPKKPVENKWAENVLEMETVDLDIYGDFHCSSDDDLGGALSKEPPPRLQVISAASCNSSDDKAKVGSLMVVLTTGSRQSEAVLEYGEAEGPTKNVFSKDSTGYSGESFCNGDDGLGARTSTAEAEAHGLHVEPSCDDADDMYDGLELNLNPVLSSEVMAQLNAEPCASSPKRKSRENLEDSKTPPVLYADLKKKEENDCLSKGDAAASENTSEDDCMKFADIERRIENIRKSKALNGDPLRSKKSKGRPHGDTNRTNGTNVQTQVEIYVNQHLKPLYRSQVITAEQFKWTVSKTAAKVMEHHGNAVTADFLITEGHKVKKLADQYLQAFAHRKT